MFYEEVTIEEMSGCDFYEELEEAKREMANTLYYYCRPLTIDGDDFVTESFDDVEQKLKEIYSDFPQRLEPIFLRIKETMQYGQRAWDEEDTDGLFVLILGND